MRQILEKSSSKKENREVIFFFFFFLFLQVRWLVWGLSWTYNNLCSFSGFRMSRHERCNLLIENFPFEQLAKPCPVCEAAGAHGVLGGSHPHSTGMFQQWTRFLFPWCSFLWYIHLSPIYPSSLLAPNSAPQSHLHIGLPFGTLRSVRAVGAGNDSVSTFLADFACRFFHDLVRWMDDQVVSCFL